MSYEKTPAEQAYCDLLAMPCPKTDLDFRRAIVMAALIGRQLEAELTHPNFSDSSKPAKPKTNDMTRQNLLHHECTAIAAKNGLAGLPDLAQHLHLQKGIQRGDAVINMDHSDDPTSTMGFYFNPAAGEGGILMATAGASHEENGLEGVRLLFQPGEVEEARAALLELVRMHEPVDPADAFSVVR